jgi:hypothetical protein
MLQNEIKPLRHLDALVFYFKINCLNCYQCFLFRAFSIFSLNFLKEVLYICTQKSLYIIIQNLQKTLFHYVSFT